LPNKSTHLKLKLINITNCIQNCKFSLSDAHTISFQRKFSQLNESALSRFIHSQSLSHRRL